MRWMFAMAVAVALVVVAVGPAASGRSDGVMSDRVMFVSGYEGYPSVTGRVVGTRNVVTITPRWAPMSLFAGAEEPSYYEHAQFSPVTFGVSPDGNTVAFTTRAERCCTRLLYGEMFAINADRTGLRRLARTENLNESDPVFSPDGKLIAYLQDANLDETNPQVSLAVMNADGTGQRTVARAAAGTSASSAVVSWNRDSRRILFTADDSVRERTLLIDLASGTTRSLSGIYAEFSPSGRELWIWYRGQVYAGSVERLTKPGYWRTLRPRAAIQRRGGAPFKVPYDSVWRSDGRIFLTMYHLKEGPSKTCRTRSDIGLSSLSGTRWLARNVCGAGRLTPSPTGNEAIWRIPSYDRRLVKFFLTPTASWKPREVSGIADITRYSWGYQPTKHSYDR